MKKKIFLPFLLLVSMVGCATERPIVWMEKGASLAGCKVFEISPVSNETGKTFEFDVTDAITQHLKSKLKEKGFIIAETTSTETNIVVLKSSLTSYDPGSAFQRWLLPGAGKTQCIVKSILIEKSTGKVIGEIVESKIISGGGLLSIGADKAILEMVSTDIANELEREVKSK